MLATILNSFKVAEIRKKLLFTAVLLALYRLGSYIPVPGVSTEALKRAGLATRRDIPVKVLGGGEITKPMTVHAHGFSKSARAAIEAAGGSCQVIE